MREKCPKTGGTDCLRWEYGGEADRGGVFLGEIDLGGETSDHSEDEGLGDSMDGNETALVLLHAGGVVETGSPLKASGSGVWDIGLGDAEG